MLNTNDGAYTAFVSYPPSRQGPGILVLPEIYNSNEHIRNILDTFANKGFIAHAPDVFWRIEPDQYLEYTNTGLTKARLLNQNLDVDLLLKDLRHAVDFLRANGSRSRLVGSLGFCLGGKLSYLCASRLGVNAAASYYGVKIESYLKEADNISCPMVLHFAGNDPRVPKTAREKISKKLYDKCNIKIHLYPKAQHGFNRVGYPPYDEKSATMAMRRTLALFRRYLSLEEQQKPYDEFESKHQTKMPDKSI